MPEILHPGQFSTSQIDPKFQMLVFIAFRLGFRIGLTTNSLTHPRSVEEKQKIEIKIKILGQISYLQRFILISEFTSAHKITLIRLVF